MSYLCEYMRMKICQFKRTCVEITLLTQLQYTVWNTVFYFDFEKSFIHFMQLGLVLNDPLFKAAQLGTESLALWYSVLERHLIQIFSCHAGVFYHVCKILNTHRRESEGFQECWILLLGYLSVNMV